jgi:hypothetical protein
MKNWKTTLGGVIAAIGTYFQSQQGWQNVLGQVMSAIGLLILGNSAADK